MARVRLEGNGKRVRYLDTSGPGEYFKDNKWICVYENRSLIWKIHFTLPFGHVSSIRFMVSAVKTSFEYKKI